jgi:aminoglycoside 2''-phosphotransferase
MDAETAGRFIQEAVPDLHVESVVFEGEGDFCRAYTVNGEWMFRLAHNNEATRSLQCETALLPQLAPTLTLPIPHIEYSGYVGRSRLAFVGYRKILGAALAPDRLAALDDAAQERCARDLGGFLKQLHAFPAEQARQAGVVDSEYPFSRTESGITEGTATEQYAQALAQLGQYSQVDAATHAYCAQVVDQLLAPQGAGTLPPALVHGDLSAEHVLCDPATRQITGVIDFTDVLITDPLLDLTYLYANYGPAFVARLLPHYHAGDPAPILARVRLLYAWYTALRLLWALDHDYAPGIELRGRQLAELREP